MPIDNNIWSFQYHGAPLEFTDVLSDCNLVFTILFTIECVMKLFSFGYKVTHYVLWIWLLLSSSWRNFVKKLANHGLFFVYFTVFSSKVLLKWTIPGLFLFIFVFSNNTIFTSNQREKCPSSIRRRDSNPRPFKHELSPITTRPGLPPYGFNFVKK